MKILGMEKEKDFLIDLGCQQLPHRKQTLYDHLVGTAEILFQNNRPDYEIKAAMFHSIYGTEFYRRSKGLTTRENIKKIIGGEAETLVHIFCLLEDRTRKIVLAEGIEEKYIESLRWMEYSNILEQNKYSRHLIPLRIKLGI
jgi:hypothetical protein